ncbi:laminin subunit beta-1-like [Neodiprion pinetum]|uniref:laminin subunit beta-1-like n=1 Tax=Neodiprion pinetum TaxID=441929 RepID=UPI001EDEAC60|nr:laminin subunit beta-1-like [Neodiprion pinetum]
MVAVMAAPAAAQRPYGRIRGAQRRYPVKNLRPCDEGPCYPATGNLLIGRENRLTASSTCGLNGPERFCIVSHLKERKKCFYCNAAIRKQRHNVENITYTHSPRTLGDSWWQSENGVENVTLQLDLEAEFHFTHIIIRFQTFRPGAMLIERSSDYGKTWRVYKYFAHNCEQTFPHVPTHVPQKLNDVVCDSRYSTVDPSTDGEIIFRVLLPNVQIDNPYSQEVQNLLKMTNLRINFTRLLTLGDDLLDNRAEIKEKYYYAIKDMAVRGSCSCYGHASRCLPLPGIPNRQDMVHGRCECTHNTKGLNCEMCEDFYNDLPWKPAAGKQTHACKKCNCNNHATSCHFDRATYDRTGRVSGGVCDDCQHNTQGQNCEICKPFYYHDFTRDISDPDACQPCDCDQLGSLDDGICDPLTDMLTSQESGRCHCKLNVEGRRCDRCKAGFWNFSPENPEGCQACSCHALGTVDLHGCDVSSGKCTCKPYVIGRDCDQCYPEFWGLSDDREGCKPCDCDLGGAYDNLCDVVTGQCSCRAHIDGRTCNEPEQNHYTVALDYLVYEGERSKTNKSQIVIREPYRDGRTNTWTGPGFIRAFEGSTLEFTIDDVVKSMEYDIVLRYESEVPGILEEAQIFVEREEDVDPEGACANWEPEDDELYIRLPVNSRSAVAVPSVCLEKGKKYIVVLQFKNSYDRVGGPTASILIDSIVLMPKVEGIPFFAGSPPSEMRRQDFERRHCDEIFYNVIPSGETNEVDICAQYRKSIGYFIFDGAPSCECNPTGSNSLLCDQYGGSCPCKPNIVGRRCDRCAPGTYGFGPAGCVPCDCDSVGAEDNFCDFETGRCKCRPNTYGRTCGECDPGFWNFPHCERCKCNGHAQTCDSVTGACHDCQDFTTGHQCDRCAVKYYGDPQIGVDIPCRPCPCPGTWDSGHSFADRCSLDPVTLDVVCECYEGYAGARCDICAENYFGSPDVQTGRCVPCDCNNNTDLSQPGNCNPHTGRCLQCLYDTDGPNCQICKPDFYGDALKQDCKECGCNVLGTNFRDGHCNHRDGQCPCLPNVIGQYCDTCVENHWRIASGEGCDPCDCDVIGSVSEKCNEYDGTCQCRSGFGGRQCNQCETNHWGNPNIECLPCECNLIGSSTQQCDRETGACICLAGIGGVKCDHCDRGYLGVAPSCIPCGECFKNWDLTLSGLSNRTYDVIDAASKIQKIGTAGIYSQEFDNMDEVLMGVRELVNKTSVTAEDLLELVDFANNLNNTVSFSDAILDEVDNYIGSISQRVSLGEVALQNMKNRTVSLIEAAAELKENATVLQEADVYGALNLTHQMAKQSDQAEALASSSTTALADADRYQKNTENLLAKRSESFTDKLNENDNSLKRLKGELDEFNQLIPDLNLAMCGASVDECDELCGGAGCGFCGGLSCDDGAVTEAERALDLAKQRAAGIKKHKDESEQLLRNMTQMKDDAVAAKHLAQLGLNAAFETYNFSSNFTKNLENLHSRISNSLNEEQPSPAMVKDLAEKVLEKNIKLNPDEIKDLADSIRSIVGSLTDSEKILEDAAEDLELAEILRDEAVRAKDSAVAQSTRAGNIVVFLTEAEIAAEDAQLAIDEIERHISLSHNDLTDILIEIDAVAEKADNTTAEIDDLDRRLTELQTQIVKNDFILTQEIGSEIGDVTVEAENTRMKTKKLVQEFEVANQAVRLKAEKSEGKISRSKLLLQRASELAADTTTKFKDINGMEGTYAENEKTLADLMSEVESLTRQMEKHLNHIQHKSQTYAQCST